MVPKASMFSPKTPHQLPSELLSSPSPGYFGFIVDNANNSGSATGSGHLKSTLPVSRSSNWPAGVSSPHTIPLISNSEYDDFKKQSELNQVNLPGNAIFSDPGSGDSRKSQERSLGSVARKRRSQESNLADATLETPASLSKSETVPEGPTHSQRSPKRLLSNDSVLGGSRRQSPADFNESDISKSLGSPPQRAQDKSLRLSLPGNNNRVIPDLQHSRAETLPSTSEASAPVLVPAQHVHDVISQHGDKVLVLDMRVSTQYAQSRITDALNLCIPTTLLKRTTYNVGKLADTFKGETQKARFQKWRSCSHIVVYDNASSQLKEATSCVNVLKKFAFEGWHGQSLVLRGGLVEFAKKFPAMVDDSGLGSSTASSPSHLKIQSDMPGVPPVVGGCPMPATDKPANPFFGNIRQNMDLIGGVGQMPVQCPPSLGKQDRYDLPNWLRGIANDHDHGKTVADRFLRIEQREKKRMEEALSGGVYDTPKVDTPRKIKIAGIEKGNKNRYHNIMPYEHSRVKLKGVPKSGCDYVNANFLETSVSKKRYIATQGPIPATFGDFWNMVWQQDVRVIVMLTAETEGNQVKAHNYWKDGHNGSVKVNFHSERKIFLDRSRIHNSSSRPDMARRRSSHLDQANVDGASRSSDKPSVPEMPSVMLRKFTISHDSHPFDRMREITQIHWDSWPDFGVPTHPSHLLGVVEHCRSVVESSTSSSTPDHFSERPVLVHCSAGCGRTGTFCTVDTVVEVLKQQRQQRTRDRYVSPAHLESSSGAHGRVAGKEDSHDSNPFFSQPAPGRKQSQTDKEGAVPEDLDLIEKVVEEFRLQRLSTVQSLRQYVLCYETVLEWIADQGQAKTA